MCVDYLDMFVALFGPISVATVALLWRLDDTRWDHELLPDIRLAIGFLYAIPAFALGICTYIV